MTKSEFLQTIIDTALDGEIVAYAEKSLAQLKAANAKRAEKPTKTQLANEPIKEQILAYLNTAPDSVAADIASAVGITTQKASALCRALVEDGKAVAKDVKVKGKGTLKAYAVKDVEGE